ncbi:hypothetical protein AB0F13_27675 [Streptomyces sp. NPDC026206]|uniref:hypothetical protein n=1 Tax=Streptomyces sp. NPDC026206 TaxID=3157089 RepID=UPI0033E47CA1
MVHADTGGLSWLTASSSSFAATVAPSVRIWAHLFELLQIRRHLLARGEMHCGRQELVPVVMEGVQPDQPRHVLRVQLREPMREKPPNEGVWHENVWGGNALGAQQLVQFRSDRGGGARQREGIAVARAAAVVHHSGAEP